MPRGPTGNSTARQSARGGWRAGPSLSLDDWLAEDLDAIEKGICDERQQEKCLDEFGEAGREWACSRCPQKRWRDIGPYTRKLLRIDTLRQAGYPLGADDLTVDEWMDMAAISRVRRRSDNKHPRPVYLVKLNT